MRFLISLLLCFAACVQATEDKVYRYVDAQGVVHYTDKPPAKDSKPIFLPKLQTFKSGPTSKTSPAPKLPVTPQFSLAINSPTPEETIRENTSEINVSVTILPALVSGYGLVYSLDGQAQNDPPLNQTSYTLTGVERGTHSISVSLLGPKGDEVASSSVTVYMKQPVARVP